MEDRLTEVSGVVYGTRVRGRLPEDFQAYLLPSPRNVDGDEASRTLQVTYRRVDPLSPMEEVEEIWESEPGDSDTPGRLTLSRGPEGGFGLTVCGEERGHLRSTGETIEVQWAGSATGAAHHLFAYGLPLWLETRGVPVLHGSVVAVGDRAVGFLGSTGMGKSVLSAELVERGCGFLADDGLALERGEDDTWWCLHGPPVWRLWPSGLEGRLGIEAESLPKVVEMGEKRRWSFAAASPSRLPLAAIYVLRRRPDPQAPVRLSRCRPRETLTRFLEHGVAAAPATALGLAGRRFELLADVAEHVPMRRLTYPSHSDTAERILGALEEDLASLDDTR